MASRRPSADHTSPSSWCNPSATVAERKLVASFQVAIQRYREFLAENALGAGKAWYGVSATVGRRSARALSTLLTL